MATLSNFITLPFIFTFLSYVSAWTVEPNARSYDHKVDLPTKRPLIVAHRGYSGAYPEHTVKGYEEAVRHGADVIECDVAVTKDRQLVCAHDNWIADITNVEQLFPDRKRTYFIPSKGRNITDYFTVDFTLSELKSLRIIQRYSFRDLSFDGKFQIPTIEEYIAASKVEKRAVGIYPETKQPEWVNSLPIMTEHNVTFEEILVDILQKHGYTSEHQPCFLQSFSQESLLAMKKLTKLPLVYLTHDVPISNATLQDLSTKFYGIGAHKGLIVGIDKGTNRITAKTDFIQRAHALGLKVHAWTFRNENQFLAFDYGQDAYEEMKLYYDLGLDGYFTDFPASGVSFLNALYTSNGTLVTPSAVLTSVFTCLVCAFIWRAI